MQRSHTTRTRIAALLAASTLFAACNTTGTGSGQEPYEPRVGGAQDRLAELQPADVAVAPLKDQTGRDDVPLDVLRGAFYEALTERMYTPLDLGYVDSHWVEASFQGNPAPDALLVVAITQWDASGLFSSGSVRAGAECALYPGGTTTETPLWTLSLEDTLSMGDAPGRPPTPGRDYVGLAAERFAQEALGLLPARDPLVAPR